MPQHRLAELPAGSQLNKVVLSDTPAGERPCLVVTLDEASRTGRPGVDFVDQPSFVLLPGSFLDGIVEVDIRGMLREDAPDYARGFVGIAYRISDDLAQYESVYLRPANGLREAPGTPRDQRAVQYYAFPDWPFDRLREEEPGRFEAAADIALGEWHRFRLEFRGDDFTAHVDGHLVLQGKGKVEPSSGRIGLWVDIGTAGSFADLSVTSF